MIDDIAKAAGGHVIRTPVGEANVASAMLQNNCIIGGEGNGGVIDLRVGPIRDSLVAMAFALQLLAQTGKTVSQLVGEIPRYSMTKYKFPADKAKVKRILDAVKKLFPMRKLIPQTASDSISPTPGFISAQATPNRLFASSPKPKINPPRQNTSTLSSKSPKIRVKRLLTPTCRFQSGKVEIPP